MIKLESPAIKFTLINLDHLRSSQINLDPHSSLKLHFGTMGNTTFCGNCSELCLELVTEVRCDQPEKELIRSIRSLGAALSEVAIWVVLSIP